MAKMTLLDIVQLLLSSMGGDEVNSISDTVESNDVAKLVKQAYLFVQSKADLPIHRSIFELTASGDSAKPTLMTLPEEAISVEFIRYDNKLSTDTYSDYIEVEFVTLDEFMKRQQALKDLTSDVGEMVVTANTETHNFLYSSDKMPEFYTTPDASQLIFDSFDNTQDTTLQKSKTMCHGLVIPAFTLSDTFEFDLDRNQEVLLLNEAKSLCFSELKQLQHPKAERTARQLWTKLQSEKRKIPYEGRGEYERLPNYGRRRP